MNNKARKTKTSLCTCLAVVAVMSLSAGCTTAMNESIAERLPIKPTNKSTQTADEPTSADNTTPSDVVTVTVNAADSTSRPKSSQKSGDSTAAADNESLSDMAERVGGAKSLKAPGFPVTEFRQVSVPAKAVSTVIPSWMDDLAADEDGAFYGAEQVTLLLGEEDAEKDTRKEELGVYVDLLKVNWPSTKMTHRVTDRGFEIRFEHENLVYDLGAVVENGKVYLALWEYHKAMKSDMAPVIARSKGALTPG